MGMFVATTIITLWLGHLAWLLWYAPFEWSTVLGCVTNIVGIVVQTFLSTGLFITAHDAMHGTVSAIPRVNTFVGCLASGLFAGMWYPRLYKQHHLHHQFPGHDSNDPDFHPSNNFLVWFGSFIFRYTTVQQLILMGIAYNVLALAVAEPRLWLFWVVPLVLSTLQLFTVGTYLPHRKPHTHTMPHNARSLPYNHVWAFVSCYFFGYHAEHHVSPGTPWYRLWQKKQKPH
jgi:beta-carotene/zeaxanthin 4-ketolase